MAQRRDFSTAGSNFRNIITADIIVPFSVLAFVTNWFRIYIEKTFRAAMWRLRHFMKCCCSIMLVMLSSSY